MCGPPHLDTDTTWPSPRAQSCLSLGAKTRSRTSCGGSTQLRHNLGPITHRQYGEESEAGTAIHSIWQSLYPDIYGTERLGHRSMLIKVYERLQFAPLRLLLFDVLGQPKDQTPVLKSSRSPPLENRRSPYTRLSMAT
jgi:hypothetical protein